MPVKGKSTVDEKRFERYAEETISKMPWDVDDVARYEDLPPRVQAAVDYGETWRAFDY